MTSEKGRRARWTTALVIAPGAAAVFGASVSWAAHTTPTTAGTAAPSTPPATVAAPAATHSAVEAARLRRLVAERTYRAAVLDKRLAGLRRQLAKAIAAANAAPAGGPLPAGQQAPAGGPLPAAPPPQNGPQVGTPAPPVIVAVPQAAPAPPAPPPVQVVTGASGTKP